MNPRVVVGLTSLLVWILSIVQTLNSEDHRPVAIVYLILGIFLFAGKRWAYRVYKFLLWLSFILSLVIVLLVIPETSGVDQIIEVFTQAKTVGGGVLLLVVSMIYTACILYYMDTDNVRMEYDIDSKKKKEDKRLVKDQE